MAQLVGALDRPTTNEHDLIKRADELRHRVFKLKMDQVERPKAKELLSSCANCRQSFDDSQEHFNWSYKMGSLMEMVAENLEEGKA